MEPTPVPRTPVSQRIGAAAAAESKEDAADAGATVHAQQDCVDTWSTDKIETFAPAAEQMIVVRSVGKPHWKVFRTMSILLLTSRGAAVQNLESLKISSVASRHGACSHCARQVVLRCGNPNFKLFDTLLPPT